MNTDYVGITYPKIFQNRPIRWFWKKFMCPRNIHLFDECMSMEHYLICDCCGFTVHIACTHDEKAACLFAEKLTYIETSFKIQEEVNTLVIPGKNEIKIDDIANNLN